MKSEAARRGRWAKAETKGEEKVTAGEKWRKEIKDREKFKRGFWMYRQTGEKKWNLKLEEINGLTAMNKR